MDRKREQDADILESSPRDIARRGVASLPRVSVITVSLNQGRYIEQCLLSVREQGYPNLEHIVMDGGSEDDTLEHLKRHEQECRHELKWRSEQDRGQSHAYNKAFELASGDWLLYLNSSDYLLSSDSIATAVKVALANPGHAAHCFPYVLVDDEGNSEGLNPSDLNKTRHYPGSQLGLVWLHNTVYPRVWHEGTLFSKDAVAQVGGYREEFRHHMDYDLFCRLAAEFSLCACSDTRVTAFRIHSMAVGMPSLGRSSAREMLAASLDTGASPYSRSQLHYRYRSWVPKLPTPEFLRAFERKIRRGRRQ